MQSSTHPLPDDADDESVLHGIGELARSGLDGETSAEQHREARAALLSRVRERPRSWRSSFGGSSFGGSSFGESSFLRSLGLGWKLGVTGACVAAFALAFFVFVRAPKRPLTFVIGGSISQNETTVRASNEEVHVRFNDGTDIAFEPGSNGRIADVTPNGARIILGEGRAHFDVRHREGSTWSVEAGSYVVRVTGTEFDLVWSPVKGTLRVVMQRGSVAVEGAKSPVPALVGGNMLDVDATGAITIRSVGAADAPQAAAVSEPVRRPILPIEPAPQASSTVTSVTPPTSASSTPALRWARRVERGEYAEVVSEASAMGIDSVVRTAGLDDLVALGDASRYSGHGEIAQSALTSIRTRFPKSQAAHTGAFLLGRMADDRGSFDEAIRLYDEYLAAGGPFSGEASGRKMIALNRSGKTGEARALAADYLEKHPDGSYASFARGLVEGN